MTKVFSTQHTTKIRMHGSPYTLASVMASQLEADPVMAACIKDHCPPEKLIRLLGLEKHIGRILAEEATATPPLVAIPAQPGELALGHTGAHNPCTCSEAPCVCPQRQ